MISLPTIADESRLVRKFRLGRRPGGHAATRAGGGGGHVEKFLTRCRLSACYTGKGVRQGATVTSSKNLNQVLPKRKTSPRWSFFSSLFVLMLLRLALDYGRGDHHHAGFEGIVAPPPGLPEDSLLPLVPLFGRRALEESPVEVGPTAVTEPPAAYSSKERKTRSERTSTVDH